MRRHRVPVSPVDLLRSLQLHERPRPLTPMMQQYRELKARDPGCAAAVPHGRFLRDCSARTPSAPRRVLGLTLTSRDKGADPSRWPASPIPRSTPTCPSSSRRASRGGLRPGRRPRAGQGAGQARGHPGRHARHPDRGRAARSRDGQLPGGRRRGRGGKLGLAWVELSTGPVLADRACLRTELADELARLDPAEMLVSELSLDAAVGPRCSGPVGRRRSRSGPSWDFEPEQARSGPLRALRHDHAGRLRLRRSTALRGPPPARCWPTCARRQKTSLGHITPADALPPGRYLALDEVTRRSLELTRTLRDGKRDGSLLAVIDRTVTPMGARLLADWLPRPLTDAEPIDARLDAVDELVRRAGLRSDLRDAARPRPTTCSG